MWSRLKAAAAEGLILGVKYGVALLVLAFLLLWAVGDYATVRGSTAYLRTTTSEVKGPQGQPLSRMDLIDMCIRDLVARQQAAAKPAPAPPAK